MAVVAALRAHVGNVGVQNNGCTLRWAQSAAGGAAGAQAVVKAGGAVVAVAALRAHARK